MGMYESAGAINDDLKQLFGSINIKEFTKEQRERILDVMCRFGAVAKFRCRSNVAYDNFVTSCFKDISKVERVKLDNESDFTILRNTLVV